MDVGEANAEKKFGVVVFEKDKDYGQVVLKLVQSVVNEESWQKIASIALMIIGLYQVVRWTAAWLKKMSEAAKNINKLCCEKKCGTKGCCKKREKPFEKDKELDMVFITRGGKCYHAHEDCTGMVNAQVQKRIKCKLCTERSEREAKEKPEKSDGKQQELEARMAQTENSTECKDD